MAPTCSGGEKQRVALARAFLKSPRVLLCDEATSALDTRTERDVLGALFSLAQGRTCLLVAHRLSTAAQCDQIVVLEEVSHGKGARGHACCCWQLVALRARAPPQGRVVESGSHEQLLAAGGKYTELWARQQARVGGEVYDSGAHEDEVTGDVDGAGGPNASGSAAS